MDCSYYEVLMVTRDAPLEVIRAAYKALSQKWHPDRNDHESAPEIMALLNRAYETLSDPERRRQHDEWLASGEFSFDTPEPSKGTAFKVDEEKARPILEKLDRQKRWKLAPWQKGVLLALIIGRFI